MADAAGDLHLEEHDRDAQIAILLTKIGFENVEQSVETLSGGWRKRLCMLI